MAGNAAHDYEVREAINDIVDASRKLLDTDARPVERGQHPKQHGCIRARFVIADNLDGQFRQGLFQQPRLYESWIRFSNGAQQDDRKPDAHGMAIKLMGVDGPKVLAAERDATTQDFVLVDSPTFFLRDALAYRRFSEVMQKAKGKEPSRLYSSLGFVVDGPVRSLATLFFLSLSPGRFASFLRLIRFAGNRIANPLTTRYWSTTAYKFGDTCMKFSVVPAEFPGGAPADGPVDDSYEALAEFLRPVVAAETPAAQPKASSADYLREALARTLVGRGAAFLFQVQLFKDNETTPIDDPTVEWSEDRAPSYTVARIWVPKQACETPGRRAFGENLSFTPWHAMPAHEPLGEINLVRKDVYTRLSDTRHRLNGVIPREPEVSDPDPTDQPPQWGDDHSAFWHVLEEELDLIVERRRHLENGALEDGTGRHRPPAAAGSGELAGIDANPSSNATGDGAALPRPGDVDSRTRQARRRALDEHLIGLALSGDGARGATFSVGVLQGLASVGMIRRLDYLSGAAGGSHAAAWLAAWLKREGNDPANVERQLDPSRVEEARAARQDVAIGEVLDEEPQPLWHLRSHITSLFRGSGSLSTACWTSVMTWLRNVLIHGLVFVPLLLLVVTGARLVVASYGLFNGLSEIDEQAVQLDGRLGTPLAVAGVVALAFLFLVGLVALGVAFSSIAGLLRRLHGAEPGPPFEPGADGFAVAARRRIVSALLTAALAFGFCVPSIVRGLTELFGGLFWSGPNTGGLFSLRTLVEVTLPNLTILSWPNFLVHAAVGGGALAWWAARTAPVAQSSQRRTYIGAALAAGVTSGVLLVLLEGLYQHCWQVGRLDLLATLVPSLALLIAVAAMVVAIAVLGPTASDAERAGLTEVSALLTRRAIYWLAGMATILYLPGIVYAVGGVAQAVTATVWLGAAVFSVVAVRSVLPRLEGPRARWLMWLASAAAGVSFIGLLGAAGLVVSLAANIPSLSAPGGGDKSPFAYYLEGVEGTPILTLMAMAAGFGLLHVLARRTIDVNLFSLCALDADRLTHCYIEASRPTAAWRRRWLQPRDQRVSVGAPSRSNATAGPVPATGTSDSLNRLDLGDEIELRALRIGRKSSDDRVYWGPQLLFNTTHVIAENGAIGRPGLRADSLVLSPLFCGSSAVGYARTESATRAGVVDPNLRLGRVAAVSGSTALPRVDTHGARPLTALFTLLSARPGMWIEKPKADGWAAASPRFPDLPAAASLGLDDKARDFLYLSGGQEFDGLGVYELIRRRCRYIIAVNAGQDHARPGTDLAMLITRCRVEFGIRIEMDEPPLQQSGRDRAGTAHCALGQIHYGDVEEGAASGVFIYFTMSVNGDGQPRDLEPESGGQQFESCRYLGNQVARAVFGTAALRLAEQSPGHARDSHTEYVPRLFAAVTERRVLER